MSKKEEETGQTPTESKKTGLFELGAHVKAPKPVSVQAALNAVGVATLNELLEIRAAIEGRLPARQLSELDLEEEVLLQFARTKQLYNDVAEDSNTPANQRAQVANSCTAILDQLIKMQTRLYGAERVKALEQALIRTLRTLPQPAQEAFFQQYEQNLAVSNAGR